MSSAAEKQAAQDRERHRDLEDAQFELLDATKRIADALEVLTAPHRMSRVRIKQHPYGDFWWVSLGDVRASGKTPAEACAAFDRLWRSER